MSTVLAHSIIRSLALVALLLTIPVGAVCAATVEVYYAPEDAPLDRLTMLYGQATRYLYVAVYGLTTPRAVEAMVAAKKRGEILRLGPGKVCAFIFEPVVGAAGGCVPAPDGYAKRVREICDKYGVLLISDEVMCGAGRTGTWRALERDGIEPDIMAVAKGLAAGYLPLGAAIYSDKVAGAIHGRYGAPMTGHTFTAHTACCAAGVAVQKIVERDKLVERVHAMEAPFRAMLQDSLNDVEAVGDIRGRGFFQAIELVADRKTGKPFDGERKLFMKIRARAFGNGRMDMRGRDHRA